MFTLNASGFGYGTGAYANTIFLNTESAIAGGCGCLSGSGDYNNGSNTGDRLMLFNNIGAIMDAFMFAGGNKYGSGALNVYFTGTASCGVSTYTLPAASDAIYNGHTICNDLSGCNSSYARLPDANNTLPITWDQSGNFLCTSCTSPCTSGATNTAGTNYPTPGLPNGNSATTWSASLAGAPVVSTTTNYAVCGATPLTFEYQINGFTNVALNATQASGNLGSYISINGATPINFSSATYNAASGITTLTANFTPPNGITTYEFVWADGNSFCTTCPGSNSTSVPFTSSSTEQECYVYHKVIVSRENALTGAPIATCSVPGSITVSGATGTNIQYTLMKQSTTGGPFLAVGGPFTSNILANIIDDDASPTLPNYQVWVSSNNAACANPAPIVVNVPNSCLGNPPCPKYITSGTGAPTFTPASGTTVCSNSNVQFTVNIQGVCNTGQVEVLYDYNPAFDPYTSGISLGLAGTSVGTVPPTSMAPGKVFINEFVPRPGAGTCAALGITPNGASPNSGEWIELYNAGPGNVDISGWAVSDGDWTATIPSGVVIAVGGYYLIGGGGTFCSSGVLPDLNIETCNCATVSPTTQDIMNLTDGGEQIALFDCSGAYVDGVLWNVGQAIPDVTDNTAPASGCGNYITAKSLNLPASAAYAATGSSMSGTNQGRYRTSTNTWVTTTTSAAVPAVLPTPKAANTGGNWNGGSLIFGTQCPPPPVTSTLNITLPDTCSQAGTTDITLKAIYRPDPVAPCSKNDVTATATYTIPSCELLTVSGSGEYCEPNSAPISISTSSALSGNYTINLSNGTNTSSINSVTGAGPFTTNISQSGIWTVSNVVAPTGVCAPDANGQADILINPIPVISSAPTSASFCYLYGFDLSSLEASIVSVPSTNQYVWYDVASGGTPIFPFVNPAATTTYYVAPTTGTPAFCENITRTPVVLNVEPIPEIPGISCNGLVLTFLPTSPNCTPIPCSGGVQYSADGVNWAAGPSFTASDPGWAGFGTATTSLVYLRNTVSPACFNYATFFNPCFAAFANYLI
ncbi:MAG: lamin tail domain-containing protein [Bacteroidetes bacterium]|nr:lamin tail domain-containing protein [Bacteroidota bacterium]